MIEHLPATTSERSVNVDKICVAVLFFNEVGKMLSVLLKFFYFASIFQGISLSPKHFLVVDWLDLVTAILIKINLYA